MKVIRNEEVASKVFVLTIRDKRIASLASPGQFVNIRVRDSYFPLLRRPFSIHYVDADNFKIIYKVIGEGTKILSNYKQGEELDIIGPLGNHFTYARYKNFLLIAGGMGVATLYFLATSLSQKGLITTLIGAKTKAEILCEPGFAKFGKVMITTEDGSYGTKGVVTDLLCRDPPWRVPTPEIIFACGPLEMLRVVKSYAQSHFIPCQLCLEQHMVCGIGVCLGCAVPSKNGYKYVCKDGPVFWAEEIEI